MSAPHLWFAAAALVCGCASSSVLSGESGVTIEGNTAVDDDDLAAMARSELRSFVARGRSAADLADAAYAMERGLLEMGHAHASVSFTAEPSEEDPRRVVFHVSEGPRATLGDVRFPGARVFPEEQLRRFFRFPPPDLLGFRETPYRLSDVESAIADIGRLHLLDGYADVTVGPAAIAWSADRTVARVDVPVREGRRHVIASVVVEGAGDAALEAGLVRALDLAGRPWHARVAAEAAAAARQYLLDRGRRQAEAEARAEVSRGPEPRARIVLTVRPGPVFRLREVAIRGQDRTSEGFLRGFVEMEPGDVLRQGAIDAAVDRLYGTGVLRSVDATTPGATEADGASGSGPSGGSRTSDERPSSDLVLAVEDLEARSFEAGIGWGSYERLRGHFEVRDRNLFGLARDLSLRTTASLVGAGVESAFADRFLLGERNTLRLAGAWSEREEPSFERRSLSGEASVRRDLRDDLWVRGGYRFRAEEAANREGRIAGAEEEGFVSSAGVFVEGTRDTRDDPLFPSSGGVLEGSLFRSAPVFGADLDYLETKLSASRYLAVADDTVVALGLRLVTRDPRDERFTLPIQDRLFLGGADSVRSFQESELGPSNARRDPVGGLTALDAHVELRRRIRGNFDGALFFDAGTVGRRAWQVDGRRGLAVGIGLRYRLPVGPVRLDFGWNPGERFAADRPWALHLSFGFSF